MEEEYVIQILKDEFSLDFWEGYFRYKVKEIRIVYEDYRIQYSQKLVLYETFNFIKIIILVLCFLIQYYFNYYLKQLFNVV